MTTRNVLLCAVALAVLAAMPAAAAPPKVELGDAVTLSTVGLELQLPKGFDPITLREPFDMLIARQVVREKPVANLAVSVFPVGPKQTAEDYAADTFDAMKKDVKIRQLKLVKQVEIKVGDISAIAQALTYKHRAVQTSALRVFFIREVFAGKPACYVLTLETITQREQSLGATLKAVLGSVKFIESQPPDASVPELGDAFEDAELGFSVKVPKGWYISSFAGGAMLAATDYQNGAQADPSITILRGKVIGKSTAKELAAKCLAQASQLAQKSGAKLEVLDEGGDAELAGRSGQQIVFRQTPVEDDKELPPVLIAQRMIAIHGDKGVTHTFTLVVTTDRDDVEYLGKLMDLGSSGFELLMDRQPTTATSQSQPSTQSQPGRQPGTTTRPTSTTRPSSTTKPSGRD